jgi:hypothetical protein
VNPQGEGGGKREGTTTHPIEGLAELGEAGKVVAGVEQEPQRHGGAGKLGGSMEGVQRSGGTASIGPGGAIYRKGKGREGRTAGERQRRGGGGTGGAQAAGGARVAEQGGATEAG